MNVRSTYWVRGYVFNASEKRLTAWPPSGPKKKEKQNQPEKC